MNQKYTFQVEMDEEKKVQLDLLFADLGLPFEDAIRVFAYQAIRMRGFPFPITLHTEEARQHLIHFFY